jgi:glycosyltransferase involved in cell wall biosynthesis
MKILLITQLYPLHNTSKNSFALHYFAKEWSKHNDVQVLRPYLPYEKEQLPNKNNIDIEGIKVTIIKPVWIPILKFLVFNAKKTYQKLNYKPDIIVSHLYNSYLNFYKVAKKHNIPFVVGIHNSDLKLLRNKLHKKRALKVIKNADGVVFRSEALRKQFINNFGNLDSPVFVANSGLPSNYTSYAKKLLDNKHFIQNSKHIKFISACSLVKLKHIDKVLRALSNIQKEGYTNWSYTIIGDGPEENKLKKLMKDLHIESSVNFTGRLPREQVFEQLKEHHIFVMPSYPETFGLAYLEAMAAGCIVIGTKGWGIDGIVNDGVNGFLCKPYTFKDLHNKIKNLFNFSLLEKNNLIAKSLNTATSYSSIQMADNYLNFLKQTFNQNIKK